MEFKELLEKILDPENAEPITLYNENDEPAEFEQLAFIPHNEQFYLVMTPANPMEGIEEGTVMIFRIDEDEESIVLEENEEIASKIFDTFIEMCEEADDEDGEND